jgi:hypothetical protein
LTLPNFLLIGANKAGTTSLYHYLRQHPQVFMAPGKEPMYFVYGWEELPTPAPEIAAFFEKVASSLLQYESLFAAAGEATAIGEASTAYLARPACAGRIRSLVPDMKLVAILRDPVARAYSAFRHYQRLGAESRTFEQATAEEMAGRMRHIAGQSYLATGRYGSQMEPYFDRFPREQIFVGLYEDLERDSRSLLLALFRFLGVDDNVTVDTSVHHNAAPSRERSSPLVRRIARLLRRPGSSPVERGRSNLDRETVSRLVDYFREDTLRLQTLIGRDLSTWLAES